MTCNLRCLTIRTSRNRNYNKELFQERFVSRRWRRFHRVISGTQASHTCLISFGSLPFWQRMCILHPRLEFRSTWNALHSFAFSNLSPGYKQPGTYLLCMQFDSNCLRTHRMLQNSFGCSLAATPGTPKGSSRESDPDASLVTSKLATSITWKSLHVWRDLTHSRELCQSTRMPECRTAWRVFIESLDSRDTRDADWELNKAPVS